MQYPRDNTKACPAAFVQDSTLVVVIEMSLSSWLVAGLVPGVSRDPLKKIDPNPDELLQLLHRWRDEAVKAGRKINRLAVAYETGRDSFWLARWLRERNIDAHVIHATSLAVSRRAPGAPKKQIASIRRCSSRWFSLAGSEVRPGHCSIAVVPTIPEEEGMPKLSPCRENRDTLVYERTSIINRMKTHQS